MKIESNLNNGKMKDLASMNKKKKEEGKKTKVVN